MPTVKPLDTEAVLQAARETRGIVTAEEATVAGALGGAVAETVAQNHPIKIKILGVQSLRRRARRLPARSIRHVPRWHSGGGPRS